MRYSHHVNYYFISKFDYFAYKHYHLKLYSFDKSQSTSRVIKMQKKNAYNQL